MSNIIATVIHPNHWLTGTVGPFDDVESAREWSEAALKRWYPLETYEYHEPTATYQATSSLVERSMGPSYYNDHVMGIKIGLLEHPMKVKYPTGVEVK